MDQIVHPVDRLVGQRVRLLRKARGMSQTDLADALGISFQQVQKYEKGTNRISASKLFEIAKAFETEVAALFADTASLGADGQPGSCEAASSARIDLQIAGRLTRVKDAQLKQTLLDLLTAIDEPPAARRPR